MEEGKRKTRDEGTATALAVRRTFLICCMVGSVAAKFSCFIFPSLPELSYLSFAGSSSVHAQTFSLKAASDSLNLLVLTTDSSVSRWRLPYPVYQFTTGDVDGDGSTDALVGVEKATRYYPYGRRLFVFKNYHGHVRPLWMGSKLGGDLQDFRFIDGRVCSLETSADGYYAVAEYEWAGFGFRFLRFLDKGADKEHAEQTFRQQAVKATGSQKDDGQPAEKQ